MKAKIKRNNEIKALFAEGMVQWRIGEIYGLSQCRISAIVYDKRPAYRCCTFCRAHIFYRHQAVCDKCKEERASERKIIREGKAQVLKEELAILRAKRIARIAENRVTRERAAAAIETKKLRKRLLALLYRRYRVLKGERAEVFLFKWQTEGREYARFMVRLRDNFTCQTCGKVRTPEEVAEYNKINGKGKMKSHDVHHINGICGKMTKKYDKRADLSGLITLCHKCHYARHDFSQRKKWGEKLPKFTKSAAMKGKNIH